jgi:D-glycero-alpha-D-manno-heptose-7-phosphate kinase
MIAIDTLLIAETASIEEAFVKIDANAMGIVFATDDGGCVVGCVTDGDIRRQLLARPDMSMPVGTFMIREFTWAPDSASREHILKLLDHRVHVVPVLDTGRRLVRVCTRQSFQLEDEVEMFARARAPARISFGGGGSDLTHHFFDQGGMVISATINKYAYASLRRRQNGTIKLYSHDLRETVEARQLSDLAFDGKLDLIKSVVQLINPPYGFEIEAATDFPVGSGLGGSASLAVAIIGCFNEFRPNPWTRYQVAEMAFQAERLNLNIAGGWQDQYAAAFGGFNYMEFSASDNLVTPLRLEDGIQRELEACTVLCYTRMNRNSGNIHVDQKNRMQNGGAQNAIQRQKDLTVAMKRHLLRGELYQYGRLLHEAWQAKREMSSLISNSDIDTAYDAAIANGALGGKILGAGGGGYLMFFVPPFERYRVIDALEKLGYTSERVSLDQGGLVSWKTRLNENSR